MLPLPSTSLEERLSALGRLIAGFAHEIGNPLNFALGGAAEVVTRLEEAAVHLAGGSPDALRRATESLDAARDASRLVLEGVERVRRLVDNVRCYAQARDVAPVRTRVADCIGSTLTLAAPLVARTGTCVHLRLDDVPPVEARPGELEQVFMNLLINACRAMQGGGELTIALRLAGDRVRVEFSDSGPGIPPSLRPRVFEAYYTTREGSEGRCGLGLYVSHDIIARHGGELRLEDSAEGATFTVELPVQR
jgi:signal transduction histidine kinase